jgi:hypothetical protein
LNLDSIIVREVGGCEEVGRRGGVRGGGEFIGEDEAEEALDGTAEGDRRDARVEMICLAGEEGWTCGECGNCG